MFAHLIADSLGLALTAVSGQAVFHDVRLRRVWALLLKMMLFLTAGGMMLYSLNDALKRRAAYSAAVAGLLSCMAFWPSLRHRIRSGRRPN
ncbi:hypothetical protein [Methylobacterium nigriterrae]|uniref:hypothetical protein n=1 Tax=Methylobacterium nigriterrae TaxID=3127512 RepID=UPI003013F96E